MPRIFVSRDMSCYLTTVANRDI